MKNKITRDTMNISNDDNDNNIQIVETNLDLNVNEERPGVGYEILGDTIGIGL